MGTHGLSLGERAVGEPARSDRNGDIARLADGEWGRVLDHLQLEVGETAYVAWLQSLRLERIDAGEAVVAAPTRFLRNWVEANYAGRMLALWRSENPRI